MLSSAEYSSMIALLHCQESMMEDSCFTYEHVGQRNALEKHVFHLVSLL